MRSMRGADAGCLAINYQSLREGETRGAAGRASLMANVTCVAKPVANTECVR